MQGLIKPVGIGIVNSGLGHFYARNQIKELRKKLGITLEDTSKLLIEKQFEKISGLTGVARYRKKRLIKPVGYGISSAGISPFYHPKQIKKLRKKLGITLTSTTGLLNENQIRNKIGLTSIVRYRKDGLIKPVGFGVSNAGISPFYHPRQIKELRKKLKPIK